MATLPLSLPSPDPTRTKRNEEAREIMDAGARDRLLRTIELLRAISLPIANMETAS